MRPSTDGPEAQLLVVGGVCEKLKFKMADFGVRDARRMLVKYSLRVADRWATVEWIPQGNGRTRGSKLLVFLLFLSGLNGRVKQAETQEIGRGGSPQGQVVLATGAGYAVVVK